jgi:hypothetical protein
METSEAFVLTEAYVIEEKQWTGRALDVDVGLFLGAIWRG